MAQCKKNIPNITLSINTKDASKIGRVVFNQNSVLVRIRQDLKHITSSWMGIKATKCTLGTIFLCQSSHRWVHLIMLVQKFPHFLKMKHDVVNIRVVCVCVVCGSTVIMVFWLCDALERWVPEVVTDCSDWLHQGSRRVFIVKEIRHFGSARER